MTKLSNQDVRIFTSKYFRQVSNRFQPFAAELQYIIRSWREDMSHKHLHRLSEINANGCFSTIWGR